MTREENKNQFQFILRFGFQCIDREEIFFLSISKKSESSKNQFFCVYPFMANEIEIVGFCHENV